MSLLHIDSGTNHGTGLHLGNLRIGDSQTAAAMTHHGVELMERINHSLDVLHALALGVSQLLHVLILSGNELMQRRIQETNGNRVAFQSLVKLLKVTLLLRKNLLQSCLSLLQSLCTDHLAECINTIALKEHVLGTAKTDTLCA